eukprot:s964_g18.t1
MSSSSGFFSIIVFLAIFFIFVPVNHDQLYLEAAVAKTTRKGEEALALAQAGTHLLELRPASSYTSHLESAPFQGPSLFEEDRDSDDGQKISTLEMHLLQSHQRGTCKMLSSLWKCLGRCRRCILCPQSWTRSRKKHQWTDQAEYQSNAYWQQQMPQQQSWDSKGKGKGYVPMQQASAPPPPPPMLMAPPMQMPWNASGQMALPVLPPTLDTAYAPAAPTSSVEMPIKEEQIQEFRAQQKLQKIVKAAKKEDHLSPEFQALVHEEQKKDNKECGRNLHAAVTVLEKAKEKVIEIESARAQLMTQWRVFLHQSVTKWQEYTTQFQSSETAFQRQLQEATWNVKKAQKRFEAAKKRADAGTAEEDVQSISDEEVEEMEAEELPRDENAQRIQENMEQVVSSLTTLSEAADKLEPRVKRPRKEDEVSGAAAKPSSTAMQPFGKAGTT